MKAFIFAMFMVVSLSLTACSGNETSEAQVSDSTSVTVDTTVAPEVVTPDSTF